MQEVQETQVRSLGEEDPLGEEMTIHSCRGPALVGSRGYPQDERHRRQREKTREISLDRAKSAREREKEGERERERETRRGMQSLAESGNALFFYHGFYTLS